MINMPVPSMNRDDIRRLKAALEQAAELEFIAEFIQKFRMPSDDSLSYNAIRQEVEEFIGKDRRDEDAKEVDEEVCPIA
jgi:hypothetical protein